MVSRLTVNQLLLVRIQLGTQMSSLTYCNSKCRYSTMVSALVFQTGDFGSSPNTCSKMNRVHLGLVAS
jgi:hypothetical protein